MTWQVLWATIHWEGLPVIVGMPHLLCGVVLLRRQHCQIVLPRDRLQKRSLKPSFVMLRSSCMQLAGGCEQLMISL